MDVGIPHADPTSAGGTLNSSDPSRYKRDIGGCYHEAGHAVVSWVLGVPTYQVRVFTPAEIESGDLVDRSGRPVADASGLHESLGGLYLGSRADAARAGIGPEMLARQDVTIEVDLAASAGGAAAEGEMIGENFVFYEAYGGEVDRDCMDKLISLWFGTITEEEREDHFHRAEDRAIAIVQSRPGWSAIGHLAAKLAADGIADGNDVDAICETTYRRMRMLNAPLWNAWRDHWPPCVKALRRGSFPDSRGVRQRRPRVAQ